MFLRCTVRVKDGKEHNYWSIVENRRGSSGQVLQRQVLYLGEINGSQKAAWCRCIEVFEESRHLSRKLCLRDSCRGLETGLEYGIELVKHGGDIPGQAFPSTLLERRNGKAQLEL